MKSSHDRRSPRRAGGNDSFFAPKRQRKLQQLCRQVHRTLMYLIPGEMADPLLQDLSVQCVLPAPDEGRLLVRLTSRRSPSEASEILDRLERISGYLRAQVATAITRKRAPELTFHLLFQSEVKS
jgi:ribosome-binding factor A